jgi:hypothetical protein
MSESDNHYADLLIDLLLKKKLLRQKTDPCLLCEKGRWSKAPHCAKNAEHGSCFFSNKSLGVRMARTHS